MKNGGMLMLFILTEQITRYPTGLKDTQLR